MRLFYRLLIIAVFGLVLFHWPRTRRQAKPANATVQVKGENGNYTLYRHGKPYYIKGASVLDVSLLHKVKEHGGNSVRVYDLTHARAILDSAYKLGLTVTLGLPVKKAVHELDYSDDVAVARQAAEIKKAVLQFKDHPALLMWVLGNEPTLFIPSRYRNYFSLRRALTAIDDLAVMVRQIDGNHPTTMVHAGLSVPLLRITKMVCGNLDLMSFNIFSPLQTGIPRIKEFGWNGPFLISEFGARGYWSMTRTHWYSRLEQTSYEKSQYLQTQYNALQQNKKRCLGAYVFVWGVKQEYTPTGFSLFSPGSQPAETEMTDVCNAAWSGTTGGPGAASIAYMLVNGLSDKQNIYLRPGQKTAASWYTVQQQQQPLQLRWEIRGEVDEYLVSSYKAQLAPLITDSAFTLDAAALGRGVRDREGRAGYSFPLTVPQKQGAYRLYLYVTNANGKVSTANACFYVQQQ